MRTRHIALVALTAFIGSCESRQPTRPEPRPAPLFNSTSGVPSVRFSEIHYDNAGTDAGEAIEVSGPAGTDLTGWRIILYNGANGATYEPTRTLSGTIPATCGARGVMVQNYPVNGIQNGSPDGMALVDPANTVIEFLSYEGPFAATNGPALGLTSTDIGVAENGSDPIGLSLQRTGAGNWSAPAASTFGACNDADEPPLTDVASMTVTPATATALQGALVAFTGAALDADGKLVRAVRLTWTSSAPAVATINASGVATAVSKGDATITAAAANGVSGSATLHVNAPAPVLPPTRLVEIHYDNVGTDVFEAIEVEGPAGTDLTGWSVVLYNGGDRAPYGTTTLSGTIPALCDGRGVMAISYPSNGIQNGSPDGFALVNASSQVVEFFSYEGTFTANGGPANGMASVDIGVAEGSATPIGWSLQRNAEGTWLPPARSTVGACNSGVGPKPPVTYAFAFSGRDPAADPALPVGFQDQLFATVYTSVGDTVTTPVTWTSETPSLGTIDQDGVVTALGEGTAVFRATTSDGRGTATWSLPLRVATASTTAQYAGNTEFGEPADANPSDDIIVRRAQYTASFSAARGTPNWVSYDLDATHFGAEDRCDCFTYDPDLPPALTRYTTAAYTGAGAAAGYGIDRGHLARSFDRTSASYDNATTFYFTNIAPEAADLNQGPWSAMENYLGDLARLQNKEVYIIAGVAGSKGTVKNQGLITIPAKFWKVAVIMPRDQGLANVHTYRDLEVIAAIMPNDPGVRDVNWQTYRTTVDAVEVLSGYDLLALLPDQVEIAVESNTAPPTAAVSGPFASLEGSAVTMSAAGSTDPDGDALTYSWTFGDGETATGAIVSHTYRQNGVYTVRVAVTDVRGLVDTAATTATVANVAPSIGAFGGATLLPFETYQPAGAFGDPGDDTWSATVDYGDGGGEVPLSLNGKQFSLSHTFTRAGTFTVTVRVFDGDATSSRSETVLVLSPAQATGRAMALVGQLFASGAIDRGNANSLNAKLSAAYASFERGDTTPGANQLGALLNELDAMSQSDRLMKGDGAALRELISRIIRSVTS